jgi:hypothetical protein
VGGVAELKARRKEEETEKEAKNRRGLFKNDSAMPLTAEKPPFCPAATHSSARGRRATTNRATKITSMRPSSPLGVQNQLV